MLNAKDADVEAKLTDRKLLSSKMPIKPSRSSTKSVQVNQVMKPVARSTERRRPLLIHFGALGPGCFFSIR